MMMKKVDVKRLLLVLLALCSVFFWGEPVAAGWQILTGSEIFVRADQEIVGDLWVMGNGVKIAGQIKGDLLIFADELELSGKVDGDVLGVTGRAVINGEVAGDFRAFSALTQVDGMVGGNLSAAGTQLVLGPQSKVGSLLAWYAKAQLLGEIAESALVNGNIFNLAGTIGGDLQVGAGQILIGEKAVIKGDLTYPAGANPVFIPGHQIGGERRTTTPKAARALTGLEGLWFLGGLLLGLLWLLLFPRRWRDLLGTGIPWRRTIGFGLGSLILLPVLSIFVMLTVVGLPLGIGLFLLFLFLLLFGELPFYLIVGRWFCGLFQKKNRLHPVFLFLVGGFVFTFLKLIPVVGFFVALGGRIVGNGLLLAYLFWREPPAKAISLQV